MKKKIFNDDMKDTKDYVLEMMKRNQIYIPLKFTKLLLVEDGSIDVQMVESDLENMGIKIIVYRNGATKPELIDLETKI